MTRLLLLLFLLIPFPVWADQVQLQVDGFGGTETNNVTTYDSGWVISGSATVNQCKIRGTPGVGTSANICGVHDTRKTWTNDMWGEIVADGTNVASAKLMITLRMTVDGANKPQGYACGWASVTGGKYQIGKYTAGTYSQFATSASNVLQASDKMNCQIVGNVITLLITRSGVPLETVTYDDVAATYPTGGNPGLIIHDTGSLRLAGSWRAGSATDDVGSPSSTCSAADVQAAINAASDGDTVSIPAGTCAWDVTVSIPSTKGITLQGAGIDVTVIQGHAALTAAATLYVTTSALKSTTRVTAMTFDQAGVRKINSNGMINVDGTGLNKYRLDHLKMIGYAGAGTSRSISIGVSATGSTKVNGALDWSGLTDHVEFVQSVENASQGIAFFAGGPQSDAAYSRALSIGSNGLHYVEKCTFTFSSANDGALDAYGGARYVFRFNTVTGTHVSHHGSDSGGYRSPMWAELYRNTYDATGAVAWMSFWRGGTGVIFDQVYTGNYTRTIGTSIYRHAANPSNPFTAKYGTCDGTSTWDGNVGIAPFLGWPCLDQTGYLFTNVAGVYTAKPAYVWKNTEDGTEVPMTGASWGSTYFADDREFYNYNASFTGASGVGRGTLAARPATCTTGVGYWATDQGSWNTSGDGTGSGLLYKCTATNTWTLYYTPYTYPHPLQGAIPALPDSPPGLAVTGGNYGVTCTITWSASGLSGLVGYNVYKGTASGIYTEISTIDALASRKKIFKLPIAATYYITVSAYSDTIADSAAASEVTCLSPGLTRTAAPTRTVAPPRTAR